jgi:hypothetical protein
MTRARTTASVESDVEPDKTQTQLIFYTSQCPLGLQSSWGNIIFLGQTELGQSCPSSKSSSHVAMLDILIVALVHLNFGMIHGD